MSQSQTQQMESDPEKLLDQLKEDGLEDVDKENWKTDSVDKEATRKMLSELADIEIPSDLLHSTKARRHLKELCANINDEDLGDRESEEVLEMCSRGVVEETPRSSAFVDHTTKEIVALGECSSPSDGRTENSPLIDDDVSPSVSKEASIDANGRVHCPYCPRSYKNKAAYGVHKRRVHNIIERVPVKCPVDDCDEATTNHQSLCDHMARVHQFKTKSIHRVFHTEDEFKVWFDSLSANQNAAFVRDHGTCSRGMSTSARLHCNRSGIEKRKSSTDADVNTTKHKKNKETAKIGSVCPAHVNYSIDCEGTTSVFGQLNHYGHDLDAKHVPFSASVRFEIEELLHQRHRPEDIPTILRQTTHSDPSKRDHYVETAFVRQIAQQLGLAQFDRSLPDYKSVDSMMNQLIKQDDSPILLYRPATAEEKLIIVIQTLSMRRQMLRYGPDLIAVDTTHDLTRYPGILVGTLMTIGAAGEGQPVAFFLVPAESELELSPVFHALKSRFPGFKTRYFISDCAHAFWNTWSKFFNVGETNRQFCLWHVWKNWTKHLAAIKSAPDRRRARAALLILARSHTKELFNENYALLVNGVLTNEKVFEAFTAYFLEYYPRTSGHLWAIFGRRGSQTTSNMHLEAYHRVLKKMFLSRQSNRRADMLVKILLNDVSHYYEYLQNKIANMGHIITARQQDASLRHNAAEVVLRDVVSGKRTIETDGERRWKISNDIGGSWTIVREVCKRICSIACKSCGVCPHEFRCHCPDAIVHSCSWPCKHAHYAAMMFGSREETEDDATATNISMELSIIIPSINDIQPDLDLIETADVDEEHGDAAQLQTVQENDSTAVAHRRLSEQVAALAHHRFNTNDEDSVVEMINRISVSVKNVGRKMVTSTIEQGYGISRDDRKMRTQPRAQALAASTSRELIAYQPRTRKSRKSEEEERRKMMAAKAEVEAAHLLVEPGTKCFICRLNIDRAIERYDCFICKETMHNGCRIDHDEECGGVQVRFSREKGNASRKTKKK